MNKKREFENARKLEAFQIKVPKHEIVGRKIVWEGSIDNSKKEKVEQPLAITCLLLNTAVLVYSEESKKGGIMSSFKSQESIKVHFYALRTSLTLDLGDKDEIELSDGKNKILFQLLDKEFSRAQWVELWTKSQAAEKKNTPSKK